MTIRKPGICHYYCSDRDCNGNKNGFAVDSSIFIKLSIGGRGAASAAEGILCVHLATLSWAAQHPSVLDMCTLQGISESSMRLYFDVVRCMMAALSREEQARIKFTKGMLVEWDECGVRAERVPCRRRCKLCKSGCQGYRLLWNRWLIGVRRGDRSMMVIRQLPWKTSAPSGGGVPLGDRECDALVRPHLGHGVINLTDGASPYEALAGGDIRCSPNCSRKSCLERARVSGMDSCTGWRPRVGRDRFKKLYSRLHLSHGIVTHAKKEWVQVKEVTVHDSGGRSRKIQLKHGTQCADGSWSRVKQAIPKGTKSRNHERIAEAIHAWAWRARQHGQDLFKILGHSCS